MIFHNDEQKRYFAVTLGLIVILLTVTFFSRTNFTYKDTTDYAQRDAAARQQQEEYAKLLAAVKPDPEASKAQFEQLINEQDVRRDIEAQLRVDQAVALPNIPQSKLVVDSRSGKDVVGEYLRVYGTKIISFNNSVLETTKGLFDQKQDVGKIISSISTTDELISDLYRMPVPAEAVAYHKANIVSFQEFDNLLHLAKAYNIKDTTDPWSELYQHYAVINVSTKESNAAFNALVTRYQLADTSIVQRPAIAWHFINTAQAQFGGVTILADIPAAAQLAIEKALAAAFSQYIVGFLTKTIDKIEDAYKISNELFYSDALNQQYINDYLNKYVADATDRKLIGKFIPQLTCGQNKEDLSPIFRAKAREYLGFDPATIRPDDPQYLSKLFKIGTMGNDENIWRTTFDDVGRQAAAAAQDATTKEILGSGYKTARTIDGQIQTTLGTIQNAQAALFDGQLNLGVNNVENIVGQLVTSVINNFFNHFVFNGGLVLKEQQLCITTPQVTPILPSN